jgi:xanthine dehydrogenase YagS FAD-binding subunit
VKHFAVVNPRTISEAAAAASVIVADAMTAAPGTTGDRESCIVKAGGIDVLDLLKEGLLTPAKIVNLKQVPNLDTIVEEESGGVRIGAMVTLAAAATHPLLCQRFAALAEALSNSASPQIRNVATLGGNLLQRPRCWYFRSHAYHCLRKGGGHCFAISGENQYHAIFNNMPCAIVHPSTAATMLVALNATVELRSGRDAARQLPLEEFFVPPERDIQRENDLRPHEILTAIHLPKPAADLRVAYIRQGEKDSFDWPLADVAVTLDIDSAGVCRNAALILGAAAPVPHRAKAAELVLKGSRISNDIAVQAARAALDGASPLAKNGYKLPLFETLVRRAILQASARHR